MGNDNNMRRTAHAIVKNVIDNTVEVLLQYNPEGECRLCSLPIKLWKGITPSLDQYIEISWNPKDTATDPVIQEIPQWVSNTPTSAELSFLRDYYGLDFSSKVLFVIGPNPPREYPEIVDELQSNPDKVENFKRLLSQLWLKTAGWGECLALTRLIPLMKYLGVDDIEFKLCETNAITFEPEQYADYSIFFLGSTKSNGVLAELYWSKFGLKPKYEFKDYELIININDQPPLKYQCEDNTHLVPRNSPDLIQVKDYFLVAKLPNPYSQEVIKPNCFISAGIGTIGTAYASVVLSGKKTAHFFYDRFGNKPFVIAGGTNMQGMFDPKRDPASFFFDGNSNEIIDPPIVLLPNALSSSKIWSIYSDEDYKEDEKRLDGANDGNK